MTASKQSRDGTYQGRLYSEKLVMMDKEDARNMLSFLLYIPPFHPDSAWKRSSKTCMKLTSDECTVEKS
jgi:hypothetical protein